MKCVYLYPRRAYQYALKYWRVHLRQASPRRLLNYVYFVNVRRGHHPICTHQVRCHIRCEVIGLHRCIEVNNRISLLYRINDQFEPQSRIIDGTLVPQSISVADSKLLPFLKEIIDVKYLGTPLFSRSFLSLGDYIGLSALMF